jgi:oligopeptide/dipeptide ABC transporter ATP-binding protein
MKENLLEVCGLKTYFRQEDRIFKAVDGVDFTVRAGEILGIVGESGCGKSVTSLSIMRLLGEKGYIAGGKILLDGTNLLELSEAEMTQVRGHKIAMIFQDPMVSLNPVYSVGDQIAEAIRAHTKVSKKEAYERALEMLKKVGIPSPEQRLKEYPHQLSGGMRQRVMIAMALSLNPRLLIADEPTTALDVTIQAQILQLLRDLNRDLGMSIMLITHDLGVIAEICDRVVVMYAGKVMESADVKTLFRKPLHPYTNGLLQAIPSGNKCVDGKELFTILGMVPSPDKFPEGCRFADRCPHANEQCRAAQPELKDMGENHLVACTRLNQSETLA